jgi:hypothetical protein
MIQWAMKQDINLNLPETKCRLHRGTTYEDLALAKTCPLNLGYYGKIQALEATHLE